VRRLTLGFQATICACVVPYVSAMRRQLSVARTRYQRWQLRVTPGKVGLGVATPGRLVVVVGGGAGVPTWVMVCVTVTAGAVTVLRRIDVVV
jgi:hypothetical protein